MSVCFVDSPERSCYVRNGHERSIERDNHDGGDRGGEDYSKVVEMTMIMECTQEYRFLGVQGTSV